MNLTSTWKKYLLDYKKGNRYNRNIRGLMKYFVQDDLAEVYFEKLRQNGSLVFLSVSMKFKIHETFYNDMIGNEMMGEIRLPVGLLVFNTRSFPEIIDIEKIIVWTSHAVNVPKLGNFLEVKTLEDIDSLEATEEMVNPNFTVLPPCFTETLLNSVTPCP